LRGLFLRGLTAGLGLACLTACVKIPPRDGMAQVDINEVVRRVKCDLNYIVLKKANQTIGGVQPFFFLKTWAARIHLILIVDDQVSLNPGASVTSPLHTVNGVGQSFTLGVGAGVTTQAVRTEELDFLLSFQDLDGEFKKWDENGPRYDHCLREPGLLLESDLGLADLVDSALRPIESGILLPAHNVPPSAGLPPAIPPDALRIYLAQVGAAQRETRQEAEASKKTPKIVPQESIKTIVNGQLIFDLQAKKLLKDFHLDPGVMTLEKQDIDDKSDEEKKKIEAVKQIVANSVAATATETKTQAIINNIVKPLYGIALASLDPSCMKLATEAQYDAITYSTNVSTFVVRADDAKDLPTSEAALKGANDSRLNVVDSTNAMANAIKACTKTTTELKKHPKPSVPVLYDPIDIISETVNFYVTSTGSVTPTWKLVRVTAPLSGTFLSGTRKDSNTLILAMGRPAPTANGGVKSSDAMNNQILSSILSQAVAQQRIAN
jgi:hypothetical protein